MVQGPIIKHDMLYGFSYSYIRRSTNTEKIQPNIPISHISFEEHTRSSQSIGGVIFSSFFSFRPETARVSRPVSLSPHTLIFLLFHKAATTTTTVDNNNNNNDNNNSVPSFKFRSFVRRLPSLSFIFVCLLFFVYCFWQ